MIDFVLEGDDLTPEIRWRFLNAMDWPQSIREVIETATHISCETYDEDDE